MLSDLCNHDRPSRDLNKGRVSADADADVETQRRGAARLGIRSRRGGAGPLSQDPDTTAGVCAKPQTAPLIHWGSPATYQPGPWAATRASPRTPARGAAAWSPRRTCMGQVAPSCLTDTKQACLRRWPPRAQCRLCAPRGRRAQALRRLQLLGHCHLPTKGGASGRWGDYLCGPL